MACHSNFNQEQNLACGIPISPLKTNVQGPAPILPQSDQEDIIDEALKVYRPNLLFKNYDIKGPGDTFLIYMMVFITHCLKEVANETNDKKALQKLIEIARKPLQKPNDNGYFMKGLLKDAKTGSELEKYQQYMRQAKEEMVLRLVNNILFYQGERSFDFKFWVGLNKNNFMNLKY